MVGEGLLEEVTTVSGPKGGEGGNSEGTFGTEGAWEQGVIAWGAAAWGLSISGERKPLEAFGEWVTGSVWAPRR